MREIIQLITDIHVTIQRFNYVYYTTAVSIIAVNFAIMFAYVRMRENHRTKIPNFMLFCHAFIDLFVGVSCLFSVLTNRGFINSRQFGPLEYSSHFLTKYIWFLAVGNLLLFTTERYIAIKKPLLYRSSITKMKVAFATFTVWVLSVVPALVSTQMFKETFTSTPGSHNPFDAKRARRKKNNFELCTKASAIIILIGIVMIFVLNILSYRQIKASTRIRIALLGSNSTVMNSITEKTTVIGRELRKEKRVLLTFFMMSVAYTISFLPSAVLLMFETTDLMRFGATVLEVVVLQLTVPLLHIWSGLINPFLIILMNIDYRCRIISFVKFLCFRFPSQQASPRIPRKGTTTTTSDRLTTTNTFNLRKDEPKIELYLNSSAV